MDNEILDAWRPLAPPSAELEAARVAAHWAAQLIGEAGRRRRHEELDEANTTLLWSDRVEGFRGLPLDDGACVTLRLRDLTVFIERGGEIVANRALAGVSVDDAFVWLGAQLEGEVSAPAYDMPARPDVFPEATHALRELADWFHDAAIVIGGIGPARTWPHHFDLATLIRLDDVHTIGVGMSPGDTSYPQPYYYVTPQPYPRGAMGVRLPPGAHWHEQGWVGAVLPAAHVIDDVQVGRVLRGALEACYDFTR
jgi:hypothetical protein